MEHYISDLQALFDEAKQTSEFDFVLTLLNYTGMGSKELSTNLYEWFEAIEFYNKLYNELSGKEKTRMGTLLYSTFFENSDFYNILGSLCRIKLGYKGSSYLFWKTRKSDRLLGIGEKHEFLTELLDDAGKPHIIDFFKQNHFKEIRNTFFHSAYSLDEEDYVLHDSEPVLGHTHLNIKTFLYPKIDNVIAVFHTFKKLYLDSFNSYQSDKEVMGRFPNPVLVNILGSSKGLQGFRIKNSVQFYGEWHDSGIWYDEKWDMWAGHNITIYTDNKETIEIQDQLLRYENKADINKSDLEFWNLMEKISERNKAEEKIRATELLVKFGNVRYQKMEDENNEHKKKSFPRIILPYYSQAADIGAPFFDITELKERIKRLEAL